VSADHDDMLTLREIARQMRVSRDAIEGFARSWSVVAREQSSRRPVRTPQ
jgi:hypothetical protein